MYIQSLPGSLDFDLSSAIIPLLPVCRTLMSNINIEIGKPRQEGIIRHLLLGKEFSDIDKSTIAQTDPGLSVSASIVLEKLGELRGRAAPYVSRFLDVSGEAMLTRLPVREKENIPLKRTKQDAGCLPNIREVIANAEQLLGEIGRSDMQEKDLMLFSFLSVWRPDLTARKDFPWEIAVNHALGVAADGFASKYYFRMNILTKAPETIVSAAMGTYADNGINILDTLYQELPILGFEDPWVSEELWDVVRMAPDQNFPLTRSTLALALRVQGRAQSRQNSENETRRIPQDFLDKIWDLTEKKWKSLSSENQGMFMAHRDLSFLSKEIYDVAVKTVVPPRMDRIMENMTAATSPEGKEAIQEILIRWTRTYPRAELGIYAKWFPLAAGAAEAHRPKSLFSRAATVFNRIFDRM
jgi:hypothetical protein